ncbi:hypothetical protein M408DRAFT_80635 [Serendipita vermifera MAFF 305830]|uniref:ERCC4 domain-containing protein n=1 Tax=Serendipita vermifera MAFF 305830 TaxID=933852 RepID=A0A0C3AQ36_SERVB|nr:hypothetical protein M408DRAFT_80635 [Serendipita vermifera MAFF 305830]
MPPVPLLPFQKSILSTIHSSQTSDLLIMAGGLGLRKIVCTLLQLYDSPQRLVLLLNATPAEESGIGDDLSIMGCRKPGLRVVTFEMSSKDRQVLYQQGGLISVTSRILVVDMLLSEIPVELISGIIVLHAEKITPQSTEAFIIRLFRQKNTEGFLKAFSDEPEHLTVGFSPLKDIMKELQVRNVHIYPRFHEDVRESLERRKADVVQIGVPMTAYMKEIHGAIIQCIEATLSDLKRSNTELNLDDLNVQSAYFRNFDLMARRQLNSVWHRVGFRTKQLVGDLATLRRLLLYLLSYDPIGFQAYVETIIASNSTTVSGKPNYDRSAWLSSDAAHIIFQSARRRCFLSSKVALPTVPTRDEAWDVLDEVNDTRGKNTRPDWLPHNIVPVLEELPKWEHLVETLLEIEDLIMRYPVPIDHPGANTVLIMCSSDRSASLVQDFLSDMDPLAPPGAKGRKFMERKLRSYLFWKGKLGFEGKKATNLDQPKPSNPGPSNVTGVSDALKKKDARNKERQGSRRRTRGAPPSSNVDGRAVVAERSMDPGLRSGAMGGEEVLKEEAEELSIFFDGDTPIGQDNLPDIGQLTQMALEADDYDEHYGLISPEQLVVVRAYSDDSDDRVLSELQPRFIIMLEPNLDFVRRIEVYRASNPGLAVRVYVQVWDTSAEEDMYLAELRREKEAFEHLIRERASMVLVLQEKPNAAQARTDAMIRTISTRNAGGKTIEMGRPLVIVDVREFRSSLPGLLHVSNIDVHPVTLTVGDYVLTPELVVERKSVPDLISSFNSGRLYTQCELMSAHYASPLLLIEFEQDKSFSLQTLLEAKSGAKLMGKYPNKKTSGPPDLDMIENTSVQSKLVLLTLAFPRLRIIWSSSPYATAEIFADLKNNNPQPDPAKAVLIGAEDEGLDTPGVNAAAEELLRYLPGITAKNVRHVMNMVGSVRELCELDLAGVQSILGIETGKTLYTFLHQGQKQ